MNSLPATKDVCLDDHPDLASCRIAERFLVQRVRSNHVRRQPLVMTSEVPAYRVSVSMAAIDASNYRMSIGGRGVPSRNIAPFRSNVIDLAEAPTVWSRGEYRYIHFIIRHAALDEVASESGYRGVGAIRTALLVDDLVLSQLARGAARFFDDGNQDPLRLDGIELVLAAHLTQHYGAVRPNPANVAKLTPASERRVLELLSTRLDGSVRLAELARECGLSVSHFARSFKASFGRPPHRWLLESRVTRAKQLLADTDLPLAEVAVQAGFPDRSAFARTFRRMTGHTPGAWRRVNG